MNTSSNLLETYIHTATKLIPVLKLNHLIQTINNHVNNKTTKDQRNYRTKKHHPGMLHQDGKWLTSIVGLQIIEWQVGRHRILHHFHLLFFRHLRTELDIRSCLKSEEY